MKYWIFQNNQVLGPYEPDEMGKISVFSPESLVCPEGRRGTSMGDWQRAGMVPDLSVALVRATSNTGGKTSVFSIAGLPSEPTLKDLAQLGSIQEKVATLEEIVLQLQEGLRAKDEELSSVHRELAGKSHESSEIRKETVAHQRESDELKRQIAGLEDRLSSVRLLSEALDKAVEEEKLVEHDVEKQGQALTGLTRDVEDLRRQLEESKARQAELAAAAPIVSPKTHEAPLAALGESSPQPHTHACADVTPALLPSHEPTREFPAMAPTPLPIFDASMPPMPGSMAEPSALPTMALAPPTTFDASIPPMPGSMAEPSAMPSFDPMSFNDPSAGALAPTATPTSPTEKESISVAPPPPAPKGKKVLMIVAVAGLAALGGLAVMDGFVPGLRKPQAPVKVLAPEPLPPPEPVSVAVPDSRQLAVEFAKAWPLPGDLTLERALENMAPSAGNLSPWMADPLAGGRVQVNYFTRSSAPGAPTIAYEFEVDLEGKTLIGRNAAAKSILTGKAAAPPALPRPKPVKVNPKMPAAQKAPAEDTLDSILAGDPAKAENTTLTDPGAAPPDGAVVETPSTAQPRRARSKPPRGAKKAKDVMTPAKGQPADETLLDDLLKE
ncbi:MAG: hypothetical protein AAB268_03250 [Elusimicrobiota bacterium]